MAKKHKKRPVVSTTWWWAWSPEVAAMFGQIRPTWTPPKKVRISRDRAQFVISARFVTERGFTNIARVRVTEALADKPADDHALGLQGAIIIDEFFPARDVVSGTGVSI